MSYKLLIAFLAAALSLALPAEACAQTARSYDATKSAADKWEAGFLALSAIDAAETISCLDRNVCNESNPIWGKHPSTGKIILTKLGLGAVHFVTFKLIERKDPRTALRAAQISAIVQGGVVLLNAHVAFR